MIAPPHAAGSVRADAVRLVVALGVFVAAIALAWQGVSSAEARIFEAMNELPDFLGPALWLPMQLGSLFGPFVVALVVWLVWRDWPRALTALLVGIAAWQVAKVVKSLVERGRPADELDQIVTRIGTPIDGLGFPSGHSTVAFALACVVSPYLSRPARWIAYAVATVVAFARIHNGAHLPLDVVGGAALGIALGLAARLGIGVATSRTAS